MEQTGRRSTAASCFFHAQSPYFAVPHRRAGRLAAARLDVIAQHLGVLMAQKRHVAHLAEMDFDGDELILEIDLIDAGLLDEPLEFGEDAVPRLGMHVREAHL